MVESCHIIFKGRVQGVGFRYTVMDIARTYPVKGFVRNLITGDVEVKVEGEKKIIEDFIKSIEKEMKRYIRKSEIDWGEYSGEFSKFEVRF
ncbi:MAG: hypothetical protein AUJ85_03170 [Elusimicrobia bacterium CG1_02_37_114]|nr:MAG: hypothetical protein AUJ85_03170 [Elusimicrobia bacterium CG1_02_37_114]PIV53127.1 MAG: acylphosphatase [Elusimicrobia bacterium CG02_land_8_20_14_3_00_37_13]PIZ12786.1 MAG: acylphosphatase [Elusimicrobia bacterium CG_4_10_14_0_8_um_filter_37_32]